MSNKQTKVEMSGVAEQPTNEVVMVKTYEVETYDDSIKSGKKGGGRKTLSPAVQSVFDSLANAIAFSQNNGGKAQVSFPHQDFPLKKERFANSAIANAVLSGKKRFSGISFSIVADAVNREGQRLNASVVRVSTKTEETNN